MHARVAVYLSFTFVYGDCSMRDDAMQYRQFPPLDPSVFTPDSSLGHHQYHRQPAIALTEGAVSHATPLNLIEGCGARSRLLRSAPLTLNP